MRLKWIVAVGLGVVAGPGFSGVASAAPQTVPGVTSHSVSPVAHIGSRTEASGSTFAPRLAPLSSGYLDASFQDGNLEHFVGTTTVSSPSGSTNVLAGTMTNGSTAATFAIQLPAGQSVTPGRTYGTAFTGTVSMQFGGTDCSNPTAMTAATVDQLVLDGSSDATTYAVRLFCFAPGADPVSLSGAFAFNALPSTPHEGYYIYQSNGQMAGHGNDDYLAYVDDLASTVRTLPFVGMVQTTDGGGYWMVDSGGGVLTGGDAGFFNDMGGLPLNQPVVGMAATPDGQGYWLVASDGGIFAFGDAGYYGSTGNIHLNEPVVGMAPTPSGHGYWLVASDGGVFAYGDAGFQGSMGGLPLNQPVVGMTAAQSGQGYWFVGADGGVFAYGDAPFSGSLPGDGASVHHVLGLST